MRPRTLLPKSTPGTFDVGFGLAVMSDSGSADRGLAPRAAGAIQSITTCETGAKADFVPAYGIASGAPAQSLTAPVRTLHAV